MSSKISWTDEALNPVVGCSKTSVGCQNCYAENMARRLAAMGLEQYKTVTDPSRAQLPSQCNLNGWNGNTAFVPSELEKPYKWKKPRTIFISSMGDLFHDSVNYKWIDSVMQTVRDNLNHTFILLTKRADNMRRYFKIEFNAFGRFCMPPNLFIGVSVEDQATANERIPLLLNTPAAKRFISMEPMLEEVDLFDCGAFDEYIEEEDSYIESYIDGVILGGESGPKARPLNPEWVRLVRDQCAAAGVPFMFKQNSAFNKPFMDKHWGMDTECKETGFPFLDGRTHTELAWRVKK